MKKITATLLAISMLMVLFVPAFADNFVNSIEVKLAPSIVNQKTDDGNTFAAIILNTTDNDNKAVLTLNGIPFVIKEYVPEYTDEGNSGSLEFCITSAAEVESAILPEIKEQIKNAEEQIRKVEELGQLDEGIGESIEAQINTFYVDSAEKIDVTDLIVSDLFSAAFVYNKESLLQLADSQKIQFMITPEFTKDDFFVLLQNVDGNHWVVINDLEWTKEGYLVIRADKLSVFAIVREKSADLSVDSNAPIAP